MDFKEFFSEENTESLLSEESEFLTEKESIEKISPNQFYDVITSHKPDWQSIIYELIHTEQLDPWDIDIVLLTGKYFEKVMELESSSESEIDFYVSSKILLAASLLLRVKSEFLLNKHIKSIDEILFGKKEENKQTVERIEIDEDELPVLIPKTPLPRLRKVTLPELMNALNKAIDTESRRIKREVAVKRARKLSEVDIPKFRRIDLKDRIKQFYAKILISIKKLKGEEKHLNKVSFSSLIGKEREEKLSSFLPLLHLSNSKKLWLEQELHLDEIWIYLYEYFNKNRDKFMEELEKDIEEMKEELEEGIYESVEGERISSLEKARKKIEAKKELEKEIKKELENELGLRINEGSAIEEINQIDREKKIDEITGFSDEL